MSGPLNAEAIFFGKICFSNFKKLRWFDQSIVLTKGLKLGGKFTFTTQLLTLNYLLNFP